MFQMHFIEIDILEIWLKFVSKNPNGKPLPKPMIYDLGQWCIFVFPGLNELIVSGTLVCYHIEACIVVSWYEDFSLITGPLWGESTGPVVQSFDVFSDVSLNKPLNKQSSYWWFEMPQCSCGSHCNVNEVS